MPLAGTLEFHATGIVADAANLLDLLGGETHIGQGGELADFLLDRPGGFAGLLNESRNCTFHCGMAEIPDRGELEQGEMVFFGKGPHALRLFHAVLNPAFGSVGAMIAGLEFMAREAEIAMEDAAVIHHTRHNLDPVLLARGQGQSDRPRFERIENEHGPVDEITEALEGSKQVEREAICGARRDAEQARQSLVLRRFECAPYGLGGVS